MEQEVKHSINYISQKTGGETGFSIPENYFDTLEDVILSKTVIPQPSKENKSFNVPEHYFSTLEDNILSKVSLNEKKATQKEAKVISFFNRLQKVIPYAAAASVLLFIGTYFLYNYNSSIVFEDITITDVETWFDTGYGTTNNTEMAMVLEASDFDDTELFSVTLNNEAIENYLNTVDTNLLLNEIQ